MTEDVLAIARATLDRIRGGSEPLHGTEMNAAPTCEKSERSEESRHQEGLISHNSLFSQPLPHDSPAAGVTAVGEQGPAETPPDRPALDLTSPHAMFEHTHAHELARGTPRRDAERLALASGAVAWVMHHKGDHERIEQALGRVEAGAEAEGQFERLLAHQNVQRPGGSR